MAAGAVLSSLDEKVPIINRQLLSLSCIVLVVLDRKHSEVSKTVWIMYVSIIELIGQAIFQTGCEILNAGLILRHRLFTSKQDMVLLALPTPSTRCPHSERGLGKTGTSGNPTLYNMVHWSFASALAALEYGPQCGLSIPTIWVYFWTARNKPFSL